MSRYAALPDHPIIQAMERTGFPDGNESPYPRCPICGEECDTIFKAQNQNAVGCDNCINRIDAWEMPECFQ